MSERNSVESTGRLRFEGSDDEYRAFLLKVKANALREWATIVCQSGWGLMTPESMAEVTRRKAFFMCEEVSDD